MNLISSTAVVAAASALFVACGANHETATARVIEQPTVVGSNATPTGEPEAEAPSVFEALLARAPDNQSSRESLLITDIAAVRAFAGIQPPGPDADLQAVLDYIAQISRAGQNGPKTIIPFNEGWISGFHNYVREFSTYPYLAFDARNADQIAVYQESPSPPITVEIVAGRYNSDASAKTLSECVACPAPTVVEQGDAAFWVWGEDLQMSLQDRTRPPAFDQMGRGGRIWIDDGFVVRAVRTADMREVIDATADAARSLAGDERYVLAARALSEIGVTSAIFTAMSYKADDLFERIKPWTQADAFQTSEATLKERLHDAPLLKSFELLAAGTGFDGAEPYTSVILVHDDAQAAAANVSLLRQRIEGSILPLNASAARKSNDPARAEPRYWRDVIKRYDVKARGRVLVATLYGVGPSSLVPANGLTGIPPLPLTVSE